MLIKPHKLEIGDTIYIVCPSHSYTESTYNRIVSCIKKNGYNVKLGKNIFKVNTYGTMASLDERLEDFHDAVYDKDSKLVLFSGGQGAAELLPYIDYKAIRENPKIYSSYSDGTSILNAIYFQSSLVTFYGCSPRIFEDMRYYNFCQFKSCFSNQHYNEFCSDTEWNVVSVGEAQGILIGGYYNRIGMMLSNPYFSYNSNSNYLLFLEGRKDSFRPDVVATYLAFLEQTSFFKQVRGVIIGYYDNDIPNEFFEVLLSFAKRTSLPIVYTDDFGHGVKQGIIPIGVEARLTATPHEARLFFNDNLVC